MMLLAFAICGLVGIALGIAAWRSNGRSAASGNVARGWLLLRRWAWVLGLVLGGASYFIWYPYDAGTERYRVMGFPFMAAAFDSAGRDYVGSITPLAIIGNFLFFALTPQLMLWVAARMAHRSGA